ncbi:trimeric intracellular cation channel family protein [Granulicoccus phenolivorans]|uniref:trimeric intracellular cation channel family protein n=1 Tax=Granulicoccus phenolivorans TaxID=266854 RepID=UPI00042716DB|nr:trimeric intracellular cation channel family protein [Granulicoccus phenolivorans]
MTVTATANDVFYIVDLGGVLANGLLGGTLARTMRMDPAGFVVLAIISGLGGGFLRDISLQQGFPAALTTPAYLIVALIAAGIAFVVHLERKWAQWLLAVIDALALGCWAATGTSKALVAGLDWLPSIMLGILTAVGGGMIRDVLVGRVPAVFGGSTLYATSALIGSAIMAICQSQGQSTLGMALSIIIGGGFCLVARWRHWRLPEPVDLRLPRRTLTWPTRLRRSDSGDGSRSRAEGRDDIGDEPEGDEPR